jgi:ferredoxin
VGAGQCVVTAAAVFDQGEDDGIVVLLTETPGAELRDQVQLAAQLCPAQAIEVLDA